MKSLLVLFFILIVSIESLAVLKGQSGFNRQWAALLQQAYAKTNGKKFFVGPQKTLDDELQFFVEKLSSRDADQWACKYPARYYLLNRQGLVPNQNLSLCPDLKQFLDLAPLESLSLVFVSESLSQPSSIMGHSFIKISGKSAAGFEATHAISFFTRMDDVDPLVLIWQSFVVGKKGYYSLSPYQETLNHYLFVEGRNVWEYEIKLSAEELELLHYYLYELRNIELTYYFHAYNCSTILAAILGVAIPEAERIGAFWATPLDLVRFLKQRDLINQRKLHYSNTWLIKTLDRQASADAPYLNYRRKRAVIGYELESSQITKDEWEKNLMALEKQYGHPDQYLDLDLDKIATPEDTIQDSNLGIFYRFDGNRKKLGLRFTPLSHDLLNNQRGYSFESEVKLLAFNLEYDLSGKLWDLEEVDIFSVRTLQRWDQVTGGFSSLVSFKYGKTMTLSNQIERQLVAKGAFGRTYGLHTDIDFFMMGGGKIGVSSDRTQASLVLEGGMIIREVYDMKTVVSLSHETSLRAEYQNRFEVGQSLSLIGYELRAEVASLQGRTTQSEELSVGFLYFF